MLNRIQRQSKDRSLNRQNERQATLEIEHRHSNGDRSRQKLLMVDRETLSTNHLKLFL